MDAFLLYLHHLSDLSFVFKICMSLWDRKKWSYGFRRRGYIDVGSFIFHP